MLLHTVKVYPSKINLPKKKQLAWKIAEIASDNSKLNNEAIEMVINRVIDNASVAIAMATDALSITLLITISIASLFNFELSLAISAIFHASCFFFGKLIFDG